MLLQSGNSGAVGVNYNNFPTDMTGTMINGVTIGRFRHHRLEHPPEPAVVYHTCARQRVKAPDLPPSPQLWGSRIRTRAEIGRSKLRPYASGSSSD